MDNFNGQNQFGANQMNQQYQQMPQNMQYQQMPQNMQYQQMPQNMQYQQMPQNVQYAQPQMIQAQDNNTKPKKKKSKKILFIGIPVVAVAVLATILLLVLFSDKYDIKNRKEFAKICEKIFDYDIEKIKLEDRLKKAYGMKESYGTGDVLSGGAQWSEFETEEDAEAYFDYFIHLYIYSKEYRSIYFGEHECDVKVEDNYFEAYRIYENGDMGKIIIAQEDEYFVYVKFNGDEDEVEKKSKKFLEEITK